MTRPPIGADQSRNHRGPNRSVERRVGAEPKQAEAAKNAVEANRFLAEGEAELAAMLGMEEARNRSR